MAYQSILCGPRTDLLLITKCSPPHNRIIGLLIYFVVILLYFILFKGKNFKLSIIKLL